MSTFMIGTLIACFLYNFWLAFFIKTRNNLSTFVFKVIPFFFAVVIGIFLLGHFGIVVVNI